MSGGFQGFGSQGARARRSDAQPMDKNELLKVLRELIDPNGPIEVGSKGLSVRLGEGLEIRDGMVVRKET